MTDREKYGAPTGSKEFGEMWSRVCKLPQNRPTTNKPGKRSNVTHHSPSAGISKTRKSLETPKRRARYTGLNNADCPSDGEVQDIIWDPTSPDNQRQGSRDTRVVKISDIADRIAPKDAKPATTESPLMQWIGDSSVLCTPEVRPPRLRRASTRQSNVDLVKLARQFDINMHNQGKESTELTSAVSNLDTSKHVNVPGLAPGETRGPASGSQQVEAELHALFDGPTQRISGRLSQSSSASTCSQPGVSHPRTQGPEVKCSPSGPAPGPGREDDTPEGVAADVDFDDDWDDLFDDSMLLEINSEAQPEVAPKLSSCISGRLSTSKSEPAIKSPPPVSTSKPTSVPSPGQATSVPPPVSRSSLIELCPKPKTTNRSTFKLDSNPSFQGKTAAAKDVPKPSLTEVKPRPTAPTNLDPGRSTSRSNQGCSTKDFSVEGLQSESQWDDGDDDELLCQACDTVERISNSQPEPAGSSGRPDDRSSAPLPVRRDGIANRGSPCGYVRSNSAPATSSVAGNRPAGYVKSKADNSQSRMHPSHSGSGRGKFTQIRSAPDHRGAVGPPSAAFRTADAKSAVQQQTVSDRNAKNSGSRHAPSKRPLTDSVVMNNKVLVTRRMEKCSQAEIERKKQEALARRRARILASQSSGGGQS